ncbi:MAG: hypothetical protein JWM34_4434 [Ilumatobacteraceae bacterium]|nr:hypothetical protein [Ilumatobacteraceae bacterium]
MVIEYVGLRVPTTAVPAPAFIDSNVVLACPPSQISTSAFRDPSGSITPY